VGYGEWLAVSRLVTVWLKHARGVEERGRPLRPAALDFAFAHPPPPPSARRRAASEKPGYAASNSPAAPMPPPTHIVTIP
jgi:hypothetical protein